MGYFNDLMLLWDENINSNELFNTSPLEGRNTLSLPSCNRWIKTVVYLGIQGEAMMYEYNVNFITSLHHERV